MKTKTRSVQQIIEEQMQRWQLMKTKKVKDKQDVSTITISREPGSGGRIIAKKLAGKLGFEVFHQEVLLEMDWGSGHAKRLTLHNKWPRNRPF